VVNGRLVAPLAGDLLADDGLAIADPPPTLTGASGLHFYPRHPDVVTALERIPDHDIAVTVGRIDGQTYPDWRMPLYLTADGLPIVLPAGRRCSSFQVTRIYSDVPVFDYGLTVRPLRDLQHAG
jgi:hypothetical protein